jgi:hypothetical protein
VKVRLTQQIQGARDGRDWPEPGTEVDLPDAEARSLIAGGSAVEAGHRADTVLVPPMGVHTPGRTAMPADATSPLVEAPADATADPAAARRAVAAAAAGDFVEGPAGVAHQKRTGLAHTPESLKEVGRAEEQTRPDAAAAAPKVGESDQPARSTAKK